MTEVDIFENSKVNIAATATATLYSSERQSKLSDLSQYNVEGI